MRARRVVLSSERDGHYRIEDLFGVRHRVSASAPTFIPAVHFTGVGASRRETVDLRPAMEARDIDIVLEGGGVEVKGVVKDLAGGPIEGAQVLVSQLGVMLQRRGRQLQHVGAAGRGVRRA